MNTNVQKSIPDEQTFTKIHLRWTNIFVNFCSFRFCSAEQKYLCSSKNVCLLLVYKDNFYIMQHFTSSVVSFISHKTVSWSRLELFFTGSSMLIPRSLDLFSHRNRSRTLYCLRAIFQEARAQDKVVRYPTPDVDRFYCGIWWRFGLYALASMKINQNSFKLLEISLIC